MTVGPDCIPGELWNTREGHVTAKEEATQQGHQGESLATYVSEKRETSQWAVLSIREESGLGLML